MYRSCELRDRYGIPLLCPPKVEVEAVRIM